MLDPDTMAPHALGAPAARLPEQAQQASQKSQISQQEEQADWAMAAESAPEYANLGRRLAPGSAPGPPGKPAHPGCRRCKVTWESVPRLSWVELLLRWSILLVSVPAR